MNVTRISVRYRSIVLSERFDITIHFCRIVLYWTNAQGDPRQRAFFASNTDEDTAHSWACAYMTGWLKARLIEAERKQRQEAV